MPRHNMPDNWEPPVPAWSAALAGVAAWIAFSLTGPAQFIPLGFYSNALWIKVSAFQLVTSIVAAIAGAALYKDAVKLAGAPGD